MSNVTLRNVNAIGYTDLPAIGRVGPSHNEDGSLTDAGSGCLMPGETFEVDSELAKKLLLLVGTFELVSDKKSATSAANRKG